MWHLFMDGVQLTQGCRATSRRLFSFLPLEAPGTHFFTTKLPEAPGARFIDLGRMKG